MATYLIREGEKAIPVLHVDNSGNPVSNTRTSGIDKSANAPTGPGAASSFTYNSATQNLLATIAANANRANIEVMNTTGALIVLVIDDGSNTAGTTSLLPLAAGASQYAQGGAWSSNAELGRVRVYGTTGTFVYARES